MGSEGTQPQLEDGTTYHPRRPTRLDKIKNLYVDRRSEPVGRIPNPSRPVGPPLRLLSPSVPREASPAGALHRDFTIGRRRCSAKPPTAVSLVVPRIPSVLSAEVEQTTRLRSTSGPVTGEGPFDSHTACFAVSSMLRCPAFRIGGLADIGRPTSSSERVHVVSTGHS